MRIVFDACLPYWLPASISPVFHDRHRIEHVAQLYGDGIKDPDWIGRLTEEGGAVFITLDKHLRKRPAEVQALIASTCVGVLLTAQWQADDDPMLVARLLLHWGRIEEAGELAPPAMFELPWTIKPRPLGKWRGYDKIASRIRPLMSPQRGAIPA